MNIDEAFGANLGSSYVGEIGKRQEFVLLVTSLRPVQNGYAVELVHFEDEEKNVLIWWASHPTGFQVGEKLNVKATVKSHTIYQGTKQTAINRVKVLPAIFEPEAWTKGGNLEGETIEEKWDSL